jgi:hypothetical protein
LKNTGVFLILIKIFKYFFNKFVSLIFSSNENIKQWYTLFMDTVIIILSMYFIFIINASLIIKWVAYVVGVFCQMKTKKRARGIPRWWLEGGSRKWVSYSEILERHRRHTLQAKSPRRGKTLTPPHLQPAQRISTSC